MDWSTEKVKGTVIRFYSYITVVMGSIDFSLNTNVFNDLSNDICHYCFFSNSAGIFPSVK